MGKIAEVIKYEGDNSTFVWKHPSEDFNSLTQLIVHESQEALFFMNGQALDLFGPGRHTLETQNIPKVGKFLNKSTAGKTPFHCEVYFINKTVQMAIKWGTDSKVRFVEPHYGVPLEIGACGTLNLEVTDARKLLIKLIGTKNGIAWDDGGYNFTKSLSASFRPLISSSIKTSLPKVITEQNIDILDIDKYINLLSSSLKDSINPAFDEYGLAVPELYVTTVLMPEADPNYRQIKELHAVALQTKMIEAETAIKTAKADSIATIRVAERKAILEEELTSTERMKMEMERDVLKAQAEAQKIRLAGLAEAEVMRAKGYTERDVIQADVQKAYAEGLGNMTISGTGGSVAGDMLGLGVGFAAAGAMSSKVGEMFKGFETANQSPVAPSEETICPNCHQKVPANSKFCLECGTKIELLQADEVICPQCGKKTKKGKFCMECGSPLVRKCPKCGLEVPDGSKFCLECGEKL